MSILIGHVDYSPLFNAVGAKGQAKQAGLIREQWDISKEFAKLQREERTAQAVEGLAKGLVEAGTMVYQIAQKSALEKAKTQVFATQEEADKMIAEFVINNQIAWEDAPSLPSAGGGTDVPQAPAADGTQAAAGETAAPSGKGKTFQMPDDYTTWFNDKLAAIDQQYKFFPEIRTWMKDQLFAMDITNKRNMMAKATERYVSDFNAAFKTNYAAAMDSAVAAGDFRAVDAVINGADLFTPQARETMKIQAKAEFDFGVKQRDLRALTTKQGYDAGIAQVGQWVAAGMSAEQADVLTTDVLNTSKQTAAALQTQAEAEFNYRLERGAKPEAAIKDIVSRTPVSYQADLEKVLTASWKAEAAAEDEKADSEMLSFYGSNPENPAKSLMFLRNRQNGFSGTVGGRPGRMYSSTYLNWEGLLTREIEALASGKKEGSTPEALAAVEAILRDPMKTPQAKQKAMLEVAQLRDPKGNYILSSDDAHRYMGFAEKPFFNDPAVARAVARVSSWCDYLEQQAEKKGDQNGILAAQQKRQTMMDQLTRSMDNLYSRTKPPTTADIEGEANTIISGQAPTSFPSDQTTSLSARNLANKWRSDVLAGKRNLDPETAASLQRSDLDTLVNVYGIQPNQIEAQHQDNQGLPVFDIRGINPKNPTLLYRYMFKIDPSTGNAQLWGEDSSGNFIPTQLQTLQEKADAEKKRQEAEEKKRISKASAQATTNLTTVLQNKGRIETTDIAPIAAATGLNTENVQLMASKIEEFKMLFKGQTLTKAQIANAAKGMGITAEQLEAVAKSSGIKVNP